MAGNSGAQTQYRPGLSPRAEVPGLAFTTAAPRKLYCGSETAWVEMPAVVAGYCWRGLASVLNAPCCTDRGYRIYTGG